MALKSNIKLQFHKNNSGNVDKPIHNKDILDHTVKRIDHISRNTLEKLLLFVNTQWITSFNKLEHVFPWTGIKKGVIAPVVRIDMTPIYSENQFKNVVHAIYEIETNPEGWHALFAAGHATYVNELANSINNVMLKKLSETFRNLDCKGFINLNPSIGSDIVLANFLGLQYHDDIDNITGNNMWWIRTPHISEQLLENDIYTYLANHSLVDIFGDSRKDYLIKSGLAGNLATANYELKDIVKGVCVKPIFGTRSHNTYFLKPCASLSEIKSFIKILQPIYDAEKMNEYIVMPYIAPAETKIDGEDYEVIWRLFLIWNTDTTEYKFLGGITTANPYSKSGQAVNGSQENALFWPVEIVA